MKRRPTLRRSTRVLRALLAAVLAGTWVGARADAQTDRINELERRLDQSLRLIEQLQRKVEKLEAAAGAAPADADKLKGAVADQNTRIETLQEEVTQLGSGLSMRSAGESGLPLHGFADVGFGADTLGRRKGFSVGSFDLYLTPQFTERTKALVELLFEVDKQGNLATDAERLQIGYTFSDEATLWAGRFHTPYGYWNVAFHHGQEMQTSILRPRFIDFEDKGGIVPAHTVGLWLTGKRKLGEGRLSYDAYLGNGPRIAVDATTGLGTLDPNAARDDNHQAMVGFNVGYEPESVEGLKLGLHGLRGSVGDNSAAAHRTRLAFLGGYLAYVTDDREDIAEYYRFANRDESGAGGAHRSWAGFVQMGRHLGERWTGYGRVERTVLDQQDMYFALLDSGRSYQRGVVGLRYNVDPRAALKLELNRTRFGYPDRASEGVNEIRTEYSVRF